MKLTWSKQMSVGNESPDSGHKKILILVNEVALATRAKDCTHFAETSKLLEHPHMHLGNAAGIAQTTNYRLDQHHLEHRHILKEMRLLEKELADCPGKYSENITSFTFH